MLFCWRAHDVVESGLQLTKNQAKALVRLKDEINKDEINDNTAAIDSLTHKFSMSLIQHSDFRPQLSAIKYFCGTMGYNLSESRWKLSEEYSPFLAAMQFGIRVLSLEHCVPKDFRDNYQFEKKKKTPLEQFQTFHAKWLIEAAACPFA